MGREPKLQLTWNTKKGAVALSLNSSEKSGTTISALQETRPHIMFTAWGLRSPLGNKEPGGTVQEAVTSMLTAASPLFRRTQVKLLNQHQAVQAATHSSRASARQNRSSGRVSSRRRRST